MTDFVLIMASLKARFLNSLLSVLLTAFGVALAVVIIQFGHHVQGRLGTDGQGIDIVVGAKGSPLQLILSSVYHIDIPAGNIAYKDAQKWMKHPQVKMAIPLALGDNWRGYRIVGTTHDYPNHYGAVLAEGRLWDAPFEAVAGASVGLSTGQEFSGAHGLMEGGHAHDDARYKIVGVMAPTGTVLDRLILTSVDSVLNLHGIAPVEGHEHHHHNHAHDHGRASTEPEITALLLTTKTPIANVNLPRMINRESNLQAANPAYEIVRLSSMLGIGGQSFAALSAVLVIVAALSIFAGLAGSLENRMGDLAVLRAIGYSKFRLCRIVMGEGMIIVTAGIFLGISLGLGGFVIMAHTVAPLAASGAQVHLTLELAVMILAVLAAGLAASVWPALRAAKIDPARQLSRSV